MKVKVLLEASGRGSVVKVARNAGFVQRSPAKAWPPLGYRTPRSSGKHGLLLKTGVVQAFPRPDLGQEREAPCVGRDCSLGSTKKKEEVSCFLKSSLYRAMTSSVAPSGAGSTGPMKGKEGSETIPSVATSLAIVISPRRIPIYVGNPTDQYERRGCVGVERTPGDHEDLLLPLTRTWVLSRRPEIRGRGEVLIGCTAVSYTHLTLPTKA